MTKSLQVCVFCASRAGSQPSFTSAAVSLATQLHANNYRLLYGGGNSGLMGAVAKRMAELGGDVHGVIPRALIRREIKFAGEDEGGRGSTLSHAPNGEVNGEDKDQKRMREETIGRVTTVESMHERKEYFAENGDAFVALPGGFGTLDELVEIITWSQIGIHAKPIVLYNVDGFYDNLLKFIEDFHRTGLVDEETRGIVVEAKTAEEVIKRIQEYVPPGGRMELDWKKKQELKN